MATQPEGEGLESKPPIPHPQTILQRFSGISLAGIIFIYMSAASFIFIAINLRSGARAADIRAYIPEVILSGIAIFTALLGVRLVRAAGLTEATGPGPVINPKEWDMLCEKVKEGNEEAVTQYIRLTSLTGFTGVFTKLGLQGLPLATIAMTMFFSVLYFWDKAFLDLAKLTLGAFIGSFVQRQVSASQGAGSIKLASGERVQVSPSPSSMPY